MIAAPFCGDSFARGRRLTTTLALASCFDSRNTESFGRLICTRARSISLSAMMERSSSPSMRAAVIDLFGELGEAEVAFVEQLEADAAGFGEALRRHAQPQFGHLVRTARAKWFRRPPTRYSTFSSFSFCITAPASSAARFV